MWKIVMVATAALAVGCASIVYAQQRDGDQAADGGRFEGHHREFSPADRAAFLDARIAALKAGLELMPDQAKNWSAFEQALRDMAQVHAQLRAAREASSQNPTAITLFERMARRADDMAKKSTALKRIADTGAPLYQSLNDAQKERFKKLARLLLPHHDHMGERWPAWRDLPDLLRATRNIWRTDEYEKTPCEP